MRALVGVCRNIEFSCFVVYMYIPVTVDECCPGSVMLPGTRRCHIMGISIVAELLMPN